jgi:hypothetical protein
MPMALTQGEWFIVLQNFATETLLVVAIVLVVVGLFLNNREK